MVSLLLLLLAYYYFHTEDRSVETLHTELKMDPDRMKSKFSFMVILLFVHK